MLDSFDSPLDCKEIQPVLKEISPEYSLEELMLQLKLQYFGHLTKNWLIWKDPDAGKDWRNEERGMTEDEMVGWHHRLNGHEIEQAPGVGDGQGGLACCSPWGRKESDRTERLNWTERQSNYRPRLYHIRGAPRELSTSEDARRVPLLRVWWRGVHEK